MEKEQVASYLTDMFRSKEWFDHVGFDQYNRVVVYVHKMDSSVVNLIPEFTEDHRRIMVHFASSVRTDKNDVVNRPQSLHGLPIHKSIGQTIDLPVALQAKGIDTGFASAMEEEDRERILEERVQKLTDELDRLEKICGSNVLQDIFYEIHDKGNAVTNLSARYLEVRQRMEVLYNEYGFDIIYDELDG